MSTDTMSVETVSVETVVVEILDSHGAVRMRERIALGANKRSFTIGRGVHADVTLDDAYAAALHASVEIAPDGRILASDLGSVNGIVVAGQRHHATAGLALADAMLQIGQTRLRVRTGRESLEPEKPDRPRPVSRLRDPGWIAGIGAAVGVMQLIHASWLGAPRDLAVDIVTALAVTLLVVAVWVAFWALLSRVMRGEWRWLRHSAIFLGIAVVVVAANGMVDLGWFAFSLPRLGTLSAWIGAIALGALLYLHLMHASGLTARRAGLVACAIPMLAGGVGYWLLDRGQMRDVNHIGAAQRIYPPALRLRGAGTVDDYFKGAAGLRGAADRKRKAVRADDAEDDADE